LGDRTISENNSQHRAGSGANIADNPDMLKHLPHWLLFTIGVCALGLALVLSPNEAISRGDTTQDYSGSIELPNKNDGIKLISLTLPSANKAENDSAVTDNNSHIINNSPVLTAKLAETVASETLTHSANETVSTAELQSPVESNSVVPIIVASINPNTTIVNTKEFITASTSDSNQVKAVTTENNDYSDISALINPSATQKNDLKPVKVKNGENLALILDRMGVSPRQVYDLISVGKETDPLKRLHPGDIINVDVDEQGELQQLKYELDHERTLDVRKQLGQFDALIIYHDLERRTKSSTGVIQSSLFLAAKKAGLSTNLTMELASIFGWDIDFVLDIRTGDRFTVLYEEVFRDGKKIRDGNIIAAEFINRGKTHRAFRYTDTDNRTAYYTAEGRSLRSTFLRTPIEFARVSSKFNLKRKHPVLNRIRAHKGVDYAAPTGTAIHATADGKVTFRGNKGGYGRTVVLQHGSKYTTLYAHLSNFRKGVTSGKTVKQGDVIGYVGKTGLATGPHLHYEFRVNGVHRNPLTVKLPSAAPIKKSYLADFQSSTQSLVAQLIELSETAVARVDN